MHVEITREKEAKPKEKKSDYDILAITENSKAKKELHSKTRKIFEDIGIAVQLIIEDIEFVNSNLEEKQYFFTDIKREGKILYNSGKHELAHSQKLTSIQRREIAEDDFEKWFRSASRFSENAEFNIEKKYFQEASFMLQQVAEMCYTAIEMVFTHNPYEHNLKELRDRILQFNRRLEDALPYETEQEQELFDYLNFAYIGGRYRSEKEFPVTKEQLDYWDKETKKLLDLTKIICKERIECLKEIEQKLNVK